MTVLGGLVLAAVVAVLVILAVVAGIWFGMLWYIVVLAYAAVITVAIIFMFRRDANAYFRS